MQVQSHPLHRLGSSWLFKSIRTRTTNCPHRITAATPIKSMPRPGWKAWRWSLITTCLKWAWLTSSWCEGISTRHSTHQSTRSHSCWTPFVTVTRPRMEVFGYTPSSWRTRSKSFQPLSDNSTPWSGLSFPHFPRTKCFRSVVTNGIFLLGASFLLRNGDPIFKMDWIPRQKKV